MKRILYCLLLVSQLSCMREAVLDTQINSTQSNCLMTKSDNVQSYYYSSTGKRIALTESLDYKFVIFDHAVLSELKDLKRYAPSNIFHNEIKHCTFSIEPNNNDECVCAKVHQDILLSYSDHVLYSAPYYITEDGNEIGVTNIFRIKLKEADDIEVLLNFVNSNNIEILSSNMIPLWYTLSCTSLSTNNALEYVNQAYESGLFAACEVEFTDNIHIESNLYSYNDPGYSSQWNLQSSAGFNLGIDNVHYLSKGNGASIAVVDNGIYIEHPDLNIISSWDATSEISPATNYIYVADTINHHGTATSGVIGAQINNETGIVGIAPDALLTPISVKFGVSTYDTSIKLTSVALADAIYFAAINGADVISNSWSSNTDLQYVNSAISFALSSGRNGKGSVVVFASGNQSQSISRYPHASNPNIISVGNSDHHGYRYITSNYGSDLDVVAPGTNVYLLAGDGEYITATGTSVSCPQVAAIAGLILSVNPDLTYSQVSEIIDKTAGRISTYSFIHNDDKPHGLWNEEVGYGLVNAMDAVSLAKGYYNLISFDYTGQMPEVSITADKDISVIWDWETSDIEDLETTSLTTFNLTHTYSTSKKRRIYIAEKVDFVTDTIPTYSTAIRRFDLSKGGYVSDIDIKPVNSALEYVRIIGGASFPTQTISVSDLPALKELYIVNAKNASVTVDDCPELTKFGSSRYIWGAPMGGIVINPLGMSGDSLDPNVVGDPGWPSIPEPVVSFSSLSITSCPKLHTLSLENVGLQALNFTQFPNLKYLYLTSGSTKIVGGGSNLMNPSTYGVYLKNAIQTLPSRNGTTTGKVLLRCVSSNNSSYIPVTLGTSNYNMIMSDASSRNWNVVWDSGVNY